MRVAAFDAGAVEGIQKIGVARELYVAGAVALEFSKVDRIPVARHIGGVKEFAHIARDKKFVGIMRAEAGRKKCASAANAARLPGPRLIGKTGDSGQ